MVAQDFFSRGIPTVIVSGCVHSPSLFQTVAWTMDLSLVQCTVIALQVEEGVREDRQKARGKEVDVGTDMFHLAAKDVDPAQLIGIDTSEQAPEETIQSLLTQLSFTPHS